MVRSCYQPFKQVHLAGCQGHLGVVYMAQMTRRIDVRVRVFDDGVGLRYELPEQPGYGAVRIVDGAVRRLAELGHCSSAGDRARLATNMMTVLAGQTRPQPIISLSDAEFLPKREG